MRIIKRDGRETEFNGVKIINAIKKAMAETELGIDSGLCYEIADDITFDVGELDYIPTVEVIQDMVEEYLMASCRKDVAKRYILYREERNQLRNKSWEMDELQRDIYENKYRFQGESFNDFLNRVSGGNQEIKKLIKNKDFAFAGRILAGRGVNKNVTLSNCYVLPAPEDNLESIFDTAKQSARTYSYGGGVGFDITKLRPKGSPVNNAALTTSGAVSFMELYSTTTGLIGQKGRRGALMISMDVDHPDILDFINVKRDLDKVTNANISAKFNDDFFENMTTEKENILYEMAKGNWETGEPGALYWDKVRNWHWLEHHPEYVLNSTNPCLVGDTLIQTVEGNIPIKDLVGKKPYVYAMDEDGKLTIKQATNVWLSKRNAELVKVVSGKGEIICTPDHKIFTTNRGWVEAKDLITGDRIKGLNRKTTGHRHCAVTLSGGKYEREHRFVARHFFDIAGLNVHHIDDNGFNNKLSNLEPITQSEHSRISNTGRKIETLRDEEGRFVEKEIKTERINKSLGKKVGNNWFVEKVIHLDYVEDVFDMSVPEVHNFIANNMVVHNCGEQPLPDYGSCLLGSINLSNFVLNPFTDDAKIDNKQLESVVRATVRGMNEVLDEGIPLHPLKEQQEVARDFRQIGLGDMGVADMFIKLGVRYGSPLSVNLSRVLGRLIQETAILESVELAKKYGSYPKYDFDIISKSNYFKSLDPSIQKEIEKHGMRNSHILSIAPTGSISTMYGVSGGIEPIFATSYTRTTKSLAVEGDTEYKVYTPVIKELMKYKGITSEEDLPDYVVTSHDIPYRERIMVQSAWQEFIDSAISSTINLNEDATIEDIIDIYKLGWKYGLKGVTVFRNNCFRTGILKTEEKSKNTCPDCGGELMFSNGCNECRDCGFSACSL